MTVRPRRVRGPIEEYNPRNSTRALLADVDAVLRNNLAYWPLSVRAIYYRLLGTGKYPKSRQFAARVSEHVGNARRAGWIDWEAVYDSGEERARAPGWTDATAWLDAVRREAAELRLDRQAQQSLHLLVWCEAKGLIPMLSGVANEFGVDVMSTSGYDSTSIRHQIGTWAGGLRVPLVVLHVGDLDQDGQQIYHALKEDVTAWAEHAGGRAEFVRLAVTPEQVTNLRLPDDPEHPGNVQAEAIPPGVMAEILTIAVEERFDPAVYATVVAHEAEERQRAVEAIGRL